MAQSVQFSKIASGFQVVRITGPSHNILNMCFCNEETETHITNLSDGMEYDASGKRVKAKSNICADDVLREVKAGVAKASADLGIPLYAFVVSFLDTDTGPESVYKELAEAIVRHFAAEIVVDIQNAFLYK